MVVPLLLPYTDAYIPNYMCIHDMCIAMYIYIWTNLETLVGLYRMNVHHAVSSYIGILKSIDISLDDFYIDISLDVL